ncbi:HEAT repeat domain-containing protein [Pseudanabaenaceae cyanobacterium LEGE 13415]|nr:HEAT repeat domain-containing protein [Pseudanabaenaceae cyanobacterium LEGE 13415]
MVQSLMAIATFVAVVGGIIFGVSRYEKSNAKETSIDRTINPTPEPMMPPVKESIAVSPVEEAPASTTETPVTAAIEETPEVLTPELATTGEIETTPEPEAEVLGIAAPVTEAITETPEFVATSSETISIDETSEPRDESEEVILPPVIQDPKRLEAEEPRAQTIAFTIPPTIQDPKRPNDGTLEDLTQEMLVLGQSKDLKHVSRLMQYATHADSIVRGNAAIALGQIAHQNAVRDEVERSIPVLGKLTQDADLKVRLYAVQALGEIRSQRVLPYLQKALQSPSGSVMKAANRAFQNLKLQYGETPAMQVAQEMLKKAQKSKC